MTTSKNHEWARILLGLSVLLTLLPYLNVLDNSFVDWDDTLYIQHNLHIRHLNLTTIRWSFVNFYGGYWIPLTWLSFAFDFWIGRLEPWVYHLDNLMLHLANTAMVFLVSHKLLTVIQKHNKEVFDRPSFVAFVTALLFGIHPIHVESVAWASERKDLLYCLFSLLSFSNYLSYTSLPQNRRWNYFGCLAFFLLAILSKPMAVSLPFILILLDYWPLKRSPRKIWIEKIPFFTASFLSAGVAVLTQFKAGAGWDLSQAPLSFRFTNACHSLLFYLLKMVVPIRLSGFYPIHLEKTFSLEYLISTLLVLLISLFCFQLHKKRPYLTTAWLYYLLSLAPVLGIVQVGNQAAADRFTYLPSLGPFLLAAAAFVFLLSRWRAVFIFLFVVAVPLLSFESYRQVSVWKNSISLWENVLKIDPHNNLVVHNNLGEAYEEAGRFNDALIQFEDATINGTSFFYAHWGKARTLSEQGRLDESIQEFKMALAINPHYPPLYAGMGMVNDRMKKPKEALEEVQAAIQMDPHYAEAYEDLGTIYEKQRHSEKSAEAFHKAYDLDPDNGPYLRNWAEACQRSGQNKEALALYRELSRKPRSLLALTF